MDGNAENRPPSLIQTITVGSGFSPDQPWCWAPWVAGLACAGLTAGREFRPAPKVTIPFNDYRWLY